MNWVSRRVKDEGVVGAEVELNEVYTQTYIVYGKNLLFAARKTLQRVLFV